MNLFFKNAKRAALAALALAALAAPLSAADNLEIDTVHSSVVFAVKHFGVSYAYGRFNQFDGKIEYDAANAANSNFELTIKADSVDTANERRDKHLRSPDFFNANQFGEISFKSTKVERASEKQLKVTGDLTMNGVTKSISVDIEETGQFEHPRRGMMYGFHGTAVVKRSEFNVSYGVDNGAIGDDVKLMISLETVKK